MSSPNGNGTDLRNQRYAEYLAAMPKEKTGFVKDPFSAIGPILRDPLNSNEQRVLQWFKVSAWGRYCLYCLRADETPACQQDCANELGLNKGTVSAAVKSLTARDYVRIGLEDKLLYPVVNPRPDETPKVTEASTFQRYLEDWKVTEASTFEELQVIEAKRKTILLVRQAGYKKWKRLQQKDAVSLLKIQRDSEQDYERTNGHPPSLPKPPASVRPFPSPIREELRAWLTATFDLPTLPDAKILDQISSHLPDADAFERFKSLAADARPRKWALFETIAIACEECLALNNAKLATQQAEHEARQRQLARWRAEEPGEPYLEPEHVEPEPAPPISVTPDPRLEEAERSRRETAAQIRIARQAEAEENRKRYAKPPGIEHGVIELPKTKGASG